MPMRCSSICFTDIESQITLYKAEQELIDKYYNLHIAFNKLERAYGRKIPRRKSSIS